MVLSVDGMQCSKGTEIEDIIRLRRAQQSIRAMGDNCEGRTGTAKI